MHFADDALRVQVTEWMHLCHLRRLHTCRGLPQTSARHLRGLWRGTVLSQGQVARPAHIIEVAYSAEQGAVVCSASILHSARGIADSITCAWKVHLNAAAGGQGQESQGSLGISLGWGFDAELLWQGHMPSYVRFAAPHAQGTATHGSAVAMVNEVQHSVATGAQQRESTGSAASAQAGGSMSGNALDPWPSSQQTDELPTAEDSDDFLALAVSPAASYGSTAPSAAVTPQRMPAGAPADASAGKHSSAGPAPTLSGAMAAAALTAQDDPQAVSSSSTASADEAVPACTWPEVEQMVMAVHTNVHVAALLSPQPGQDEAEASGALLELCTGSACARGIDMMLAVADLRDCGKQVLCYTRLQPPVQ